MVTVSGICPVFSQVRNACATRETRFQSSKHLRRQHVWAASLSRHFAEDLTYGLIREWPHPGQLLLRTSFELVKNLVLLHLVSRQRLPDRLPLFPAQVRP